MYRKEALGFCLYLSPKRRIENTKRKRKTSSHPANEEEEEEEEDEEDRENAARASWQSA
jgi:hypothetical protein